MLERAAANLKKTAYYLKRNGLKETWRAVMERLQKENGRYFYEAPDEDELERQRRECREVKEPVFSILVPLYRTPEKYLRELIDSVRAQTYPAWELILADASENGDLVQMVRGYGDTRIVYFRLQENGGISENSNRGLEKATGEFVGLLDHDDLLSPDALYEVCRKVKEGNEAGTPAGMIYSDEDKCDEAAAVYYEPSRKEGFNLDLLLSNNYICHFMVLRTELVRELLFRKDYEGAQDYDLALRAMEKILATLGGERKIFHIPRVLYHWRCHEASTSANPRSKDYAYEAGRRALQDFVDRQGWRAEVRHMGHLGSYKIEYQNDIFEVRQDIGAVGGSVLIRGRIAGGRMTDDGDVLYLGRKAAYLSFLHAQDAEALDIRNLEVREELKCIFPELFGIEYAALAGSKHFDVSVLPPELDVREASLLLSAEIRRRGYRLLYLAEHSVNAQEISKHDQR